MGGVNDHFRGSINYSSYVEKVEDFRGHIGVVDRAVVCQYDPQLTVPAEMLCIRLQTIRLRMLPSQVCVSRINIWLRFMD